MTRKDFYLALAIIIDVLVVLTFSISSWEKFMDFLTYREAVGFIFWGALSVIIWQVASVYVKTIVKAVNKKD